MDSKFAKFLKDNQIDPRRLLVASRQVERLRAQDRSLKLQRRRRREEAIASAGVPQAEAKASLDKPRSGRPVTERLLSEATTGDSLSGPSKNRLLRAVNRVLEQRKKDPADLRKLF